MATLYPFAPGITKRDYATIMDIIGRLPDPANRLFLNNRACSNPHCTTPGHPHRRVIEKVRVNIERLTPAGMVCLLSGWGHVVELAEALIEVQGLTEEVVGMLLAVPHQRTNTLLRATRSTDPDALAKIAANAPTQVAQNENTSNATLMKLVRFGSEIVRAIIAEREDATSELLLEIARQGPDAARELVAKHHMATEAVLVEVARNFDSRDNEAQRIVAARDDLTQAVVAELVQNRSGLTTLLRRPELSTETLSAITSNLKHIGYWEQGKVREALLRHANLAVTDVRRLLIEARHESKYGYEKEAHDRFLARVACQRLTRADVLDMVGGKSASRVVAEEAVQSPMLTDEDITVLANSPVSTVRGAVAASNRITPAAAQRLAKDTTRVVRLALASNEKCPVAALRQLRGVNDLQLQKAVEANPTWASRDVTKTAEQADTAQPAIEAVLAIALETGNAALLVGRERDAKNCITRLYPELAAFVPKVTIAELLPLMKTAPRF